MLEQKIEKGFDGESFIDKLFEMSSKIESFSHDDIRGEIWTILMGASDTSAVLSSSVALMLALYPDIQERVFKEILTIMPDEKCSLTIEHLNKLSFLDHCINETLRLFPTAPTIARESNKSFTLKNGIVVPPGVPLVIGLRQIQMREEYWGQNAHLFDPTRFENNKLKTLPAASFIPFSYGPRNCVGKSYGKITSEKIILKLLFMHFFCNFLGILYAKMSVKCMIAHLIRHYRINTPYKSLEEIKILQTVSIRFVSSHLVKLQKRN